MTGRSDLFLGVIAAATVIMAIAQAGAIIAAAILARRVSRLADQLEHEVKPLLAELNVMARDASRATALAAAQVERADKLFAEVCTRVEQTVATVQTTIETPFRNGRALVNAVLAILDAIRARRRPKDGGARAEGDEGLFI